MVDTFTEKPCVTKLVTDRAALKRELSGYRTIGKALSIPEVLWWGHMPHGYIIIMEALGADLERAHMERPELFPHFSVANLAVEMVRVCLVLVSLCEHCIQIARMSTMHAAGILHADLKPQNFALGSYSISEPLLYLMDMGNSIPYVVDGIHFYKIYP